MSDLLIRALANPNILANFSDCDWDLLVRHARQSDLLGRITEQFLGRGDKTTLPAGVRGHLDAERVLVAAQRVTVTREVGYLEKALAPLGAPVVLLKGAAYLMADLPAAAGRHFSDIDILLPREVLTAAESALLLAGWVGTHQNAYDQHYYRVWMHELPPMQHMRRQTVLDVHHAILPLTARLRPDSRLLLAAATPLHGTTVLYTLSPADMVLHSMTHLLHNEEFSHGLRDLSDLDLLLRHFGRENRFWEDILARARQLDLTRPLFYGLRYAQALLSTPVPDEILTQVKQAGQPPAAWLPLMDALWQRVLRSSHPLADDIFGPSARFLLFLRAHWMRMPLPLLLRHLAHKCVTPKPQPGKPAATPHA